MARMRRRSRIERQKAEIGMNSLIDLTFLLLVTFIVTLPALEQGISIMLPQAKTDQLPTKDKKANVVTTPGAGFGRAGEGYIRISSFNSRENVLEAVERIKKAL